MWRVSTILVACVLISKISGSEARGVPLAEVAQHAVEQSSLTLPGSAAFHLKATIVETTNPQSDYKGEIEEYWISPEKWRRVVTSPGFSQTVIVNGDKTFEQNKGDYFPWWLDDLVTAVFDPLPMLDQLKQLNSQIPKPSGAENSTTCSRFQTRVGTPPVKNSAFLVFCFEGSRGILDSVVTPGYEVLFKDYKPVAGKQVARRFVIDPEPGTTIEARVAELSDLKSPDETMFAIDRPSAPAERLRRIRVSEATFRSLSLSTPDITWPSAEWLAPRWSTQGWLIRRSQKRCHPQ